MAVDLNAIADRVEAALADIRSEAEDVVRRGLQAIVDVGLSAQTAIDELDAQ